MTRKSGKCYVGHTEPLDCCFELIKSHQQCIPWSPYWRFDMSRAVLAGVSGHDNSIYTILVLFLKIKNRSTYIKYNYPILNCKVTEGLGKYRLTDLRDDYLIPFCNIFSYFSMSTDTVLILSIYWIELSLWIRWTPYVMDSLSSMNTHQWERQMEFTNQRDTITYDTICLVDG